MTRVRNHSIRSILLLALSLLLGFYTHAQIVFPVFVQSSLRNPTLSLSDYQTSLQDKYQARVSLVDFTQTSLRVKFRLIITGPGDIVMRTNNAYMQLQPAHILNGGMPLILGSSNELKPFFDPDHLDIGGVSRAELNSLPEGFYFFRLEVLDFVTNRVISNSSSGFAFTDIMRSDPPMLIMPANNSTIDASVAPPINFIWLKRHTSGLINAEYTLELYKMEDPNEDPNYAVSYLPWRLFERKLVMSNYNYTIHDNLLEPGNRYAWRIRVEDLNDVDGGDFKNNGYSEVFSFYYAAPCPQPELVTMSPEAAGQVRVAWTGSDDNTAYEVYIRPFASSENWQIYPTIETEIAIDNLQPGTTYEVQVKASCGLVWTAPKYFGTVTTSEDLVQVCEAPERIGVSKEGDEFTLNWERYNGVEAYLVNHRKEGTPDDWSALSTTDSTVTLTFTSSQLNRELRIDAQCDDQSKKEGVIISLTPDSDGFIGNCGAPDPFVAQVETNEKATEATLTWEHFPEHLNYDLSYGIKNSNVSKFKTIEGLKDPQHAFNIPDDINYGITYAYLLTFHCVNGSAESQLKYFEIGNPADDDIGTTGDCFPPVSVVHEVLSTTKVKLLWDKVSGAQRYEVLYRVEGSEDWTVETSNKNRITLNALNAQTVYEYQLRCVCKSGGNSLFTDLQTFDTGAPSDFDGRCQQVINVDTTSVTQTRIALRWDLLDGHDQYTVFYKADKQPISNWYQKVVQTNSVDLNNLKPGTKYNIRVQGYCGEEKAVYSDIRDVATEVRPVSGDFTCGDISRNCTPSGTPLGRPLQKGDVLTVADFEMEIDSISSSSGGGLYHGGAIMVVPYMQFVEVGMKFKDLKIDDNLCATDGRVWAAATKVKPLGDLGDQLQDLVDAINTANELIDSGLDALDEIDQMLTTLTNLGGNDGSGEFNNRPPDQLLEQGVTTIRELYNSIDELVKGGGDPQDILNELTTAIGLLNQFVQMSNALGMELTGLDATTTYRVNFSAINTEEAKYFDAWQSAKILRKFYEDPPTPNGKEYPVPHVVISEGKERKLLATVVMDNFDPDKLKFVSNGTLGQVIDLPEQALPTVSKGNKQFEITIPSNVKRVYALYKQDTAVHKIGKVRVVEVEDKAVKVVIVPKKEGSIPADIASKLNKIYEVPQVRFTVTIAEPYLQAAGITLDIEDHSLMQRYTGDMKALEDAYFAETGKQKESNTYYLFEVGALTSTHHDHGGDILGYMPRNKEVGFLAPNPNVKTIAHELGHGALMLGHTWIVDGNQPEGSTNNLMDNKFGDTEVQLIGAQWQQIVDPGFSIYGLDNVEDAAHGGYRILYDKLFEEIKSRSSSKRFVFGNYTTKQGAAPGPYKVGAYSAKVKMTRNDEKYADFSKYYVGFQERTNFSYVFYDDDLDETETDYTTIKIRFKEVGNAKYTVLEIACSHMDVVRNIASKAKRPGIADLAREMIIKELVSQSNKSNPDEDHVEDLLNLLAEEDYEELTVETRIALLKLLYSYEDVALKLCLNVKEKTNITSFHQKLLNTKIGNKSLLKLLADEFNDIDFITDGNFDRLAGEFALQSREKLGGETEYEAKILENLNRDNIYFWDGIHQKMDQSGELWYIYIDEMNNNGIIELTIRKWYKNSMIFVDQPKKYLHPFNDWFLIYVTKDIPGVSATKGKLSLIPGFTFYSIMEGQHNENNRLAIKIGIDIAALVFTGPTLATAKGIRYAMVIAELAFTTADIALLLGRDFFLSHGMSRETYEDLLWVTGVGQLAGLGALNWVKVGNQFIQKGTLVVDALKNVLNTGVNLTLDARKQLQTLIENISRAINGASDIENLLSLVKQKFALTGIPPSWFDDLSEALLQKLKGIPSNQIDDFAEDLNAIENSIKQKPELVDSWKVLDDLNSVLKTDVPTLTKLSDDLKLNPELEGWLKYNPGYFDCWNSIKHVPSTVRSDISFLQAFRKVKDDIKLQKHIGGEIKVETKSYGHKIRVSGYHKNLDEIELPNPIHGDAGIPNPSNPNDITIVSVGTAANPATKGQVRLSNKLNVQGGELPYTAQVDIEVPPGSGNFFPKTGTDGINPGSGRSSMFPENWTDDKILEEIAYVRKNLTASDLDPTTNIYSGLNSDGTFKIGMYVNGDLANMSSDIGSAFPKL